MDSSRQKSTTFCGSTAYVSPEILENLPYEPLVSDCWSMGVILYIMLCAFMPYDTQNVRKMIMQQKQSVDFYHMKGELSSTVESLIRFVFHVSAPAYRVGHDSTFYFSSDAFFVLTWSISRAKSPKNDSREIKCWVVSTPVVLYFIFTRGLMNPDLTKRFTALQILQSDWMREGSRRIEKKSRSSRINQTVWHCNPISSYKRLFALPRITTFPIFGFTEIQLYLLEQRFNCNEIQL